MKFYMPTKIYSEPDCVKNHASELAALGTKACIVTGKHSSRKNGSLSDVTAALDAEGISYCLFDEIEENPSVELIVRAAAFAKAERADFVIGIGGGSPLDASKAIAILIKNPELDGSVFYQKMALSTVPVAAVPTTAGTGSEATPYAILTRHDKQTKQSISHRVFPSLALVDSKYLTTASIQVRANTAIDALAHLLESYVNNNATDYSRMLCGYALTQFSLVKDTLAQEAASQTASSESVFYDRLMTISTIAGMAISHTGTSLPHGMSYFVTYNHGVPHGKAVGIFLAAYLANCPDSDTVSRLLSLMGFSSLDAFQSFLQKVLGSVSLSKKEVRDYADGMIKNKGKLANCPYPVDSDMMYRMFSESVILTD
jgi:alcohol dehydrogenase